MSALSFLTRLTDGTVRLFNAIQTSVGGADGSKIIATNSTGKLDASFLPPGVEVQVENLTATEDLTSGDFVNIYDNGGTPAVRKANANSLTKLANGFVLESGLATETISVYTKGVNTAFSATAGIRYYLSATVAGNATPTAPAVSANNIQQVLGVGTSQGILFEFDDPILLA